MESRHRLTVSKGIKVNFLYSSRNSNPLKFSTIVESAVTNSRHRIAVGLFRNGHSSSVVSFDGGIATASTISFASTYLTGLGRFVEHHERHGDALYGVAGENVCISLGTSTVTFRQLNVSHFACYQLTVYHLGHHAFDTIVRAVSLYG